MLKLVYFLITFTKAIFITPQTRLGVYAVFCLCYGFSETDRGTTQVTIGSPLNTLMGTHPPGRDGY